jgi:hypothetical protein
MQGFTVPKLLRGDMLYDRAETNRLTRGPNLVWCVMSVRQTAKCTSFAI